MTSGHRRATTQVSAQLTLDPRFVVGPINRRLFGSCLGPRGRAGYTGIYEPGHPTADDEGFRRDVIELVKELGVTGIRYPGGTLASEYQWRDDSIEVGLHEIASWAETVNAELSYTVNLGTADTIDALDVIEYANIRSGSTLAEERIANGRTDPFGITMWYLGDGMDGASPLGHAPAEDYAKKVSRTAKALRQLDPDVELVVAGSSHSTMPTFPHRDRVVLEHTYDDVDYLSCNGYCAEEDGDLGSFLAAPVEMDRYLDAVIATADHVKAVKRSEKTLNISFDGWSVWNPAEVHSVADAVVLGGLLISLLRHADRVTSASMSMLANVIAPVATEPGGPAWRQTTYYPFALTSRLAVGVSLDIRVESAHYDTAELGSVPLVDAGATHDAEGGRAAIFLVNRSLTDAITVTVNLVALGDLSVLEAQTLSDPAMDATNIGNDPDRVALKPNETATVERGILTVTLPAVSWTALALG